MYDLFRLTHDSMCVCVQFDVDEFVASHLNDHRKGLLGRQLSAEALLTFSKVLLSADVSRHLALVIDCNCSRSVYIAHCHQSRVMICVQ